MLKKARFLAAVVLPAMLAVQSPAHASCTIPNTLTNGQVADATQVMANFNALANCAIDETAWSSYTPSVTASSGAFTSVSATGRYKKIGKTVFVQIRIEITTNGTAATSFRVTGPFPSVSAGKAQLISASEISVASGALGRAQVQDNSSNIIVKKYDGTYLGGNGYVILVGGAYETA